MANAYTYKTTFAKEYQKQLFRQPVYRSMAREAIAPNLHEGQTLSRSYLSRFWVGTLGSGGEYTTQAFTSTAESLTVNQKPYGAVNIVKWADLLDDLDTQREAAASIMNQIFAFTDGLVLKAIADGAGSTIDNSDVAFGGSSASGPIATNPSNVQKLFTAAQRNLILQNAYSGDFSPVKRFSGVKQKDMGVRMPVAILPAYTWSDVLLSLAGRYTPQGDRVTTNGFIDNLFNFNIFVSNNLPWKGVLTTTANLSNSETITIGGVTLTGTTGTPTNPGDFKIEAATVDTLTNIANLLNAPFAGVANKSIAFSRTTLTPAQVVLLTQTTATSDTTTLTVNISGNSIVIVSETSATASWTKQQCRAIFGTSQAIDLAIVRDVQIDDPIPVAGTVSKDLVCWSLLGFKVFHEQSPRIVEVDIDTSSFTAAPAF